MCTRPVRSSESRRRGVLLLIVLSMLTLFVLLGTTYVVLASRFRSTSRAFLKIADDQNTAPYAIRSRLREAAFQVMRGTTNSRSAVRFHDLLTDKYGTSAGTFPVSSVSLEADGQLLRLALGGDTSALKPGSAVLTFRDAPESIRNTSHRVVYAEPSGAVVFVVRPPRLSPSEGASIREVLINARDFAGSGFSAETRDLPNWSLVTTGPSGSPNEPYDAIDSDNVAVGSAVGEEMSFVRRSSVERIFQAFQDDSGLGETAAITRLQQLLDNPTNPGGSPNNRIAEAPGSLPEYERVVLSSIRRASLRPFPFDHYPDPSSVVDFAGRPITIDSLLNPAGDVDNDGDGVPESVWVDVGFPPITLFDRTQVKPLVAIHCIDLDGRLNLNVHGSPAHLFDASALRDDMLAHQPPGDGIDAMQKDTIPLPPSRGLTPMLRAGLGFGAADVRLDSVIDLGQMRAVFLGTNAVTGISAGVRRDVGRMVGRNGDAVGSLSDLPRPGQPDVADGRPGSDPALWPDRVIDGNFTGRSDYWSRFAVGIDHRGQPYLLNRMAGVSVDDLKDSPYEFDPSGARDANPYVQPPGLPTAWIDQPYTPAELEAVLRVFDGDNAATLPPRLLASTLVAARDNRHLVTTESWDTPALIATTPSLPSEITEPDLVNGLKMDLNRPFGDGVDNDGNLVVDEPGETSDPFAVAFNTDDLTEGWWLTRGRLLPLNQPGPDLPGLRARQLMAQDLYRLLRFLRPQLVAGQPVAGTDDRSMAQWAVNIVDFLDADSVMTPFRYSNSGVGDQFVVWGCEHPDLLITETLAFHDRGIADTAHDDHTPEGRTTGDDDPHFDQVQVPQGSLFVELHRVRGPSMQRLPRELYDANGRLDLARVPGNVTGAAPVWRLSISRLRDSENEANIASYDPFRRNLPLATNSETFAPRGQSFGERIGDDASPSIVVDRYVWFTPSGPVNPRGTAPGTLPPLPAGYAPLSSDYPDEAPHLHNTFTYRGGDVAPLAGDFLVVGPRPQTAVGSLSAGAYGAPSQQQIVLSPQVQVFGVGGQLQPSLSNPDADKQLGDSLPPASGVRQESKACWCASPPPVGWTEHETYRIGLNISERLGSDYYEEPAWHNVVNPASGRLPYGDVTEADKSKLFLDVPEDTRAGSPLEQAVNGGSLLRQGTYLNAATVFLERLADPTRPHDPRAEMKPIATGPAVTNPNWNPYVVVDFMPIDLTVFNGETSIAQRNNTLGQEQHDLPDRPFWFCTRQRGFDHDFLAETDDDDRFKLSEVLFPEKNPGVVAQPREHRSTRHPWRPPSPWTPDGQLRAQVPTDVTVQPPVGGNSNFLYELGRFAASGDPLGVEDHVPTHSLGWVSQAYGRRLGPEVPPAYAGAPAHPLPWITWNDRPFTSVFELLFVPRTSPGRLYTDFRSLDDRDPVSLADRDPAGDNVLDADDMFGAKTPGWHLMPLTSITDFRDGNTGEFVRADNLGRIFSYVHVRSRFRGTSSVLEPGWTTTNKADKTRLFKAPFNTVSKYREPGRVNINTIPRTDVGAAVWDGILGVPGRPPGLAPEAPWIESNPDWDTFRDRIGDTLLDVGGGTAFLLRDGKSVAHEIFPREIRNTVTGANITASHPAIDTDTAWFRFEPVIRAATHATARSEVYAIWVTLGLFEVEEMPSTARVTTGITPVVERYPDRYRLLREYGSDTGQVERHRGFFIFDRSRPIGYVEGSDTNVRDGILVESYFD